MSAITLSVLRPTGKTVVDEEKAARRDQSLNGKRVGLVWNHKDYGERMLDAVEELFRRHHPNALLSRWQLKECCKRPPEGEIAAIAEHVDAVVYTLGD